MKIEIQKPDGSKEGPISVGLQRVDLLPGAGFDGLFAIAVGREIAINEGPIRLVLLGDAKETFGIVDRIEPEKDGKRRLYLLRFLGY